MHIAILLPCYNEEQAIAELIKNIQAMLKQAKLSADIYVYDNNSSDRTVELAKAAGAIVRSEPMQGKGNVVRRMFCDIDADIYVMMDGDLTYDVEAAPALIQKLIDENLDMVVGKRVTQIKEAYRAGHRFGNKMITGALQLVFGRGFDDVLSGYRVFSRRFVKSFPCMSSGFEIETELTVHALELRLPVAEVETRYFARPEGSVSKLSTYRDGFRIGKTILNLFRTEKPLAFFSLVAGFILLASAALFWPVWQTYIATGLVPRLPTAVLAMGLVIVAVLSGFCGLILDAIAKSNKEAKRLAYLRHATAQDAAPNSLKKAANA